MMPCISFTLGTQTRTRTPMLKTRLLRFPSHTRCGKKDISYRQHDLLFFFIYFQFHYFVSIWRLKTVSSHFCFDSQVLSNEERRSNFDRYGQMDENQPFGQSQHHGFRHFDNSFYFDESFFHFPRYSVCCR